MISNAKIIPSGNFRKFLKTQMNGLTGNIEKAGYPFDRISWEACKDVELSDNPSWWVYEQTAYWLDGFLRCAILLEDTAAIERARKIIYGALDSADCDGYIGPKFLIEDRSGFGRWPHVVFFRACMALYDYSDDYKIIENLIRHYKNDRYDYSLHRDVINVEIMLWLYDVTKDKEMLYLGENSYKKYNESCKDDLCGKVALSRKKPYAHGVSYNEYSKLGAILYKYTGNKHYLKESIAAYRKIDKFFMLPGGCHCSNEFLIDNDYYQSYETCDISDYTWSMYYLLKTTLNAQYGDRIEKCIFNAGIGSVTENFQALQYFSCANQIICDKSSNHNRFYKGNCWMSYTPNPGTECCAGNVNRFMPNYILNSWMVCGNQVYSLLHAESALEFNIDGTAASITESGNYPFSDHLIYRIKTQKPFELFIRIPGWATSFKIKKNGITYREEKSGIFYKVQIESDCTVEISFECAIKAVNVKGGTYLERGALVYSLPVTEKRVRVEEDRFPDFCAYDMLPDGHWAYCIDTGNLSFVKPKDSASLFSEGGSPRIKLYAKRILNAKMEISSKVYRIHDLYKKKGKYIKGNFRFTPRNKTNEEMALDVNREEITLLPYGLCKLRMTVLPAMDLR